MPLEATETWNVSIIRFSFEVEKFGSGSAKWKSSDSSFLRHKKVTHLRLLSYQNSSKKGARKVISSSALLLARKSQKQINLLIFFC